MQAVWGDPALLWALRLLLAGVFATAALSKLRSLDAFEGVVRNYRILPEQLAGGFARVLPVVECVAALGLLFETTRAAAALLVAALLVLFAWAMAWNLLRGRREIDCGCFIGAFKQRIGWPLVARNLLLALAALWLAAAEPGRDATELDLFTAGAAALSLLFAYFAFSELVERAPARGPQS